MKRTFALSALIVTALVTTIAAQSPAGWMVRADRSTNPSDPDGAGDIKFTTIAGGFKAENPTAAIFYNPANTATGAYTVKGTFKLLEPSGHLNFYGLFIGGRALDGAEQHYTYFMVAQDGSYLIKRRLGDQMGRGGGGRRMGGGPAMDVAQAPGAGMAGGGQDMGMGQGMGRMGGRMGGRGGPMAITEDVARGQNAAVRQPGADGTSMNALEVRVTADTITFAVNGTVVHTMPKGEIETDGIYGIRVNHLLNVEITDFGKM